jgi:hypothetical protein
VAYPEASSCLTYTFSHRGGDPLGFIQRSPSLYRQRGEAAVKRAINDLNFVIEAQYDMAKTVLGNSCPKILKIKGKWDKIREKYSILCNIMQYISKSNHTGKTEYLPFVQHKNP